ncbi:MAG: NAD(P)/FAD-dependent oxidoreductase [Chromatiales bacterium]|nr:NAD(P)/FAD-dependent oxidoreductase [Chromatiales bacterium]
MDRDSKRATALDHWDAIIIGSGMGGLSAAAALSRTGRKVLMLEQYQTIGGLTHSFSRNGFSWDVGIHYLSGFAPGAPERKILDWLCDTPIELEPMGAIYDVLHIGDADPLPLSRPYEAQALDLKERFPNESSAIDAWFDAIHKGREAALSVLHSRAMPQPIGAFMEWWKSREFNRWVGRTTAEVAAEITQNPELAAVFFAQWGDHGGRPSVASFAAHALISNSYLECGAWYPVGGSSVIAERMLPVIRQAGGKARAGVRVDNLLLDDERVVGVRTADGEVIKSDVVISTIGARETVDQLLPTGMGPDDWISQIRSFQPSICHFSMYLGFEGDVEAAGATRANHWIYPEGETDVIWQDVPNSNPPVMFVSFASLKDPAHVPGPREQHSGEVIIWTDWSSVSRWANMPTGERSEDYTKFKKNAENRVFELFESYFPKLAKLVVFRELATPLSTVAITGHREGAFYGLNVTPDRMLSSTLRTKTPIKGFYLAGQDAASPGIPGAMWGGVACAGSIDPTVFRHLR